MVLVVKVEKDNAFGTPLWDVFVFPMLRIRKIIVFVK